VVGAYFDVLMMAHQTALDQEAARATAPPNSGQTLPSVPGFRAPTLHLSAFPGHGGAGGGFHVNSDQVANVASAMGGDANTLQSGQSALDGEGPLSQLVAAGWETSDNLGANFGLAWDAISSFMQDLQNVYHSTSAALHKSAANYAGSESANVTAATTVSGEAA
jgi:uncharacterized protein YukE